MADVEDQGGVDDEDVRARHPRLAQPLFCEDEIFLRVEGEFSAASVLR